MPELIERLIFALSPVSDCGRTAKPGANTYRFLGVVIVTVVLIKPKLQNGQFA